ncbi:hypothetical protein [Leptolyngbya sp. 7M]|uniref:hypothetical protein n=1 Tax=Leptolyngbya sp. 7M TaxID=2812896 RepID=UPI001B8B16AF|nr:hypothetical protein [Leptolyngbya sp. 7M]QYO63756.1 hypothetical protein JVX88_28540 [Leptolyngbya sp. 7M]
MGELFSVLVALILGGAGIAGSVRIINQGEMDQRAVEHLQAHQELHLMCPERHQICLQSSKYPHQYVYRFIQCIGNVAKVLKFINFKIY